MIRLVSVFAFSLILSSCASTSSSHSASVVRIFMVGDSTMAIKEDSERPETGWGEKLADYLIPTVTVFNHAMNGRSTKSFRDEGRWQAVLDQLQPGDFVMIQFGHNDQKVNDPARFTNPYSSYRDNLHRYVEETRQRGSQPILLSSVVRRNFNEAGSLVDTHAPYPAVMRALALEMNVAFIDMNTLSENLVFERGEEGSKAIYLQLPAGVSSNYPDGVEDNTHFSDQGAYLMAGLVAMALCEMQHPLATNLKICD